MSLGWYIYIGPRGCGLRERASEGGQDASMDVLQVSPSGDVQGSAEDAKPLAGVDVPGAAEDAATAEVGRCAPGVVPESLKGGGYIDSTFINKAGERIYFIHSVFSPRVLDGSATRMSAATRRFLNCQATRPRQA